MNDDSTISTVVVIIAICACSLWGIYWGIVQNRIISAVCGLHFNVLLMMVLGAFFYVLSEPLFERLPYYDTVSYFFNVGGWFLGGYAIWLVIEWILIVRPNRKALRKHTEGELVSIPVLTCLAALSVIGYFGAQFDLATSGMGTILVVLKNFMYPILLSLLLRTRWTKILEFITAITWAGIVLALSITSSWRSDLIVTCFCILLFICARKPRFALPAICIGIFGLWIVIPTLEFKKTQYVEYRESPLKAFSNSQDIDLDTRTKAMSDFLAIRTNFLREMAYVQRGTERGMTSYLYGQSYVDSLYQLIPRVLWPNKPSYNYSTGYVVPREIGLLGWEDESTSWGVNTYAEFMYNFPVEYMMIFVPFVFCLFNFIEFAITRLLKSLSVVQLAHSTMFFIAVQLCGLVNLGTYILWGAVILVIIDRSLREVNRI